MDQEVAGHLETEPAGRHAGSDLEQVGNDAFIETFYSFLSDDHSDGIEDAFVLVAHAGHGVDLKSAA